MVHHDRFAHNLCVLIGIGILNEGHGFCINKKQIICTVLGYGGLINPVRRINGWLPMIFSIYFVPN